MRQVRLVGRDFRHVKALARGRHEPGELRQVVHVALRHLNAGDDVGANAAHGVGVEPVLILHFTDRGSEGGVTLDERGVRRAVGPGSRREHGIQLPPRRW